MNYHLRNFKSKQIIISSVNYESPLCELREVAVKLRQRQYFGEVLFDLLCVNGNNPNRFISIPFNGNSFERSQTKQILEPSDSLVEEQEQFYRKHVAFIYNSVLSGEQRKPYLSNVNNT